MQTVWGYPPYTQRCVSAANFKQCVISPIVFKGLRVWKLKGPPHPGGPGSQGAAMERGSFSDGPHCRTELRFHISAVSPRAWGHFYSQSGVWERRQHRPGSTTVCCFNRPDRVQLFLHLTEAQSHRG